MLRGIEGQEAAVEAETTAGAEDAGPTWYWDDNQPGIGDRPEWLKEKYGKVVDQAKAYIEAEKVLGSNKAPDKYDLSGYEDYLDLESEQIGMLTSKARQYKLSQEALNDLLDPIKAYHDSLLPNIDKEIEKLGPDANKRLETINRWASNNLSERALETLGKIGGTAEVIELMDEMRQMHSHVVSKVPTTMADQVKAPIYTVEQVEAEMAANIKRYKQDPGYRHEIQRKFAQAIGED